MELAFFYAQLDADGVCFAVTCHGVALPEAPTLIPLEFNDETRLGKTYADGQWSPD